MQATVTQVFTQKRMRLTVEGACCWVNATNPIVIRGTGEPLQQGMVVDILRTEFRLYADPYDPEEIRDPQNRPWARLHSSHQLPNKNKMMTPYELRRHSFSLVSRPPPPESEPDLDWSPVRVYRPKRPILRAKLTGLVCARARNGSGKRKYTRAVMTLRFRYRDTELVWTGDPSSMRFKKNGLKYKYGQSVVGLFFDIHAHAPTGDQSLLPLTESLCTPDAVVQIKHVFATLTSDLPSSFAEDLGRSHRATQDMLASARKDYIWQNAQIGDPDSEWFNPALWEKLRAEDRLTTPSRRQETVWRNAFRSSPTPSVDPISPETFRERWVRGLHEASFMGRDRREEHMETVRRAMPDTCSKVKE